MKTIQSPNIVSAQIDALEAHVALRIASRLNDATDRLPHDISERLRFGREQAMARARAVRQAAATAPAVVGSSGGAGVLAGPPSVWLRLASLMPLAVLAAGLVLIQHHREQEQIVVAAEIDTALLADELPPAAYGDPGFAEFLRSSESP